MGLCPSRNQTCKFVDGKTYSPAPTPQQPKSNLRVDAAEFIPQSKEQAERPAWELWLEEKRSELLRGKAQPFIRREDGTFTSEYRKLLGSVPRPVSSAPTSGPCEDVVQAWKEVVRNPKSKQKKAVSRGMKSDDDALRSALQRTKSDQVAVPPITVDDSGLLQVPLRHVPFGLSDRHYWSGDEDAKKSNVHRSLKPAPVRDHVTAAVTPDMDDAMTQVLHELRLLRSAEVGMQEPPRRYCVGIREVLRASKEAGVLKAVLVAPDVESAGRPLNEKLEALLIACKKAGTPVMFGLSRRRLGQAIHKSVTVSVLGLLDIRGVQASFERMAALSQ